MEALNLQQNSPEWHEHRQAHFNASDAPAMMGVSKYKSRDELLHEYKFGAPEIDSNTQQLFDRGHKAENMARPIAEGIIIDELYPVTGSVVIDGVPLSASFDGLTIMEDVSWEHKHINAILRAWNEEAEDLDEMYKVQMDQQQLVSGAGKTLFMGSDGTREDMAKCYYESTDERKQAIIDGWKQFQKDLDAFEPPVKKPEAVADAIEGLPSLQIQISGAVDGSNLPVYQDKALAYIESINTNLQTDQDFANAEEDVKFCKRAEDELKQARAAAIGSTTSIDELMKAVDFLGEQLRSKRLTLEKLVKSEKESRKSEIANAAIGAFTEHCVALETELDGLKLPDAILRVNFHEPMKGKRTIESLNNAVNTRLAEAKIDADKAAKEMRENLKVLDSLTTHDQFDSLFNDLSVVIHKAPDDFEMLVRMRVKQDEERIAEASKPVAEDKPAPVEEKQPVKQQAASSEPEGRPETQISRFERWWGKEGFALIHDEDGDDDNLERFAHKVAQAAWNACIDEPPF